ncbi:MAG TPA: toll/interleukin-1 receptor domain-containing protein [Anaerolineae bacterium]|nr:toll/interleukin-1 receptor domain-containing protein [Anaerolineae bacterium]
MAEQARYDVFLSHNSADKPAVEVLARRLVQAGIQPWLDTWNLIPGEPFQEAIEEALDRCATCAIFVGPSGTGPWQNEEMRAAIQRRVEERCGGERPFRVIPVLLPGAERGQRSRLPSFLVATTWVEFRRTLDDEAAFHRLVCGIRGLAPGPAPGEAVYAGECPYRGLRFFDVQHAPFFFGREALTEWLLNELRGDNRFLAVVGPSGSGKSSLARAGLVAALERGEIEGSETWPIAICRPGPDPLESLAVALGNVPGVAQTPSAIRDLMRDLREDERMLHLTARLALRDGPPERRLALLMDQFEELFTLCHDEELRQALVDNLLYAAGAAEGQAVVLLTLRADFYGKCAVYPRLADALSEHQVLVGPMTGDELERAIERPAQLAGCEFEAGLVERLLDDVRDQPGGLPLLQHALLELWGRREGRRLTHGAYEAIGEVEGALEKRAEAVYHRLTETEREICRRIFLRLTQPGEGTEDTKRRLTQSGGGTEDTELRPTQPGEGSEDTKRRSWQPEEGTEDTKRRVSLRELLPAEGEQEAVEAIVQALADARLVTTESGKGLGGERFVEVAHEAIIQGWSRLREWIEENRDSLRTHRQLTEAAQEWRQSGEDQDFLYRGGRLAALEEWAKARMDELNTLERKFLQASWRAARRRQRRVSAAVALITILAIVATTLDHCGVNP